MNVADAVIFMGTVTKDEDFMDCKILYIKDSCASATGVGRGVK